MTSLTGKYCTSALSGIGQLGTCRSTVVIKLSTNRVRFGLGLVLCSYEGNRTIRRQTDSRSVMSRSGQLVYWTIHSWSSRRQRIFKYHIWSYYFLQILHQTISRVD